MDSESTVTLRQFIHEIVILFTWEKIKQKPIRGVVLVAAIILLTTKTVEMSNACYHMFTDPINLPRTTFNWEIENSDFSAAIIWQNASIQQHLRYPLVENMHITIKHNKLFYHWVGDYIGIFPCDRTDSFFLTYDIQTGNLTNQYAGLETSVLRTMIPSEEGFAVVSHDNVLTQFDENGNRLWGNSHFGSRSIRNIFETDDYYYLPNARFSYKVNKYTGQKQPDVIIPNILSIYEDVMLVSGEGNEIQIRERDSEAVQATFQFSKTTSGWGLEPFVTRYNNILILTQFNKGIQAYDLDTNQFIWSLDLPNLEFEYPIIINDKIVLYHNDASLEVYQVESGDYIGQITLENNAEAIATSDFVDIAGSDNIIVIYFQNTHELVAIEVEFGQR